MEQDTVRIVRKIQLLVDHEDRDKRQEYLDQLYHWQNVAFRAANMITSHLYLQEQIKEFVYLSEGVKVKLADEKKDEAGILNCSKQHSTYKILSYRFEDEIPMNIISCLILNLGATYQKERIHYWKGERSLSNYKKDIAFPFSPERIGGLRYDEEKKVFRLRLFRVPLRVYLGNDFSDKPVLLKRVLEGQAKLCMSAIQLKNRKIIWLALIEIKKEKHELKPDVIAEASLSIEYPITVKIGKHQVTIGNREEFLYRRLAIQAAIKRVKEGLASNRSGKGKKRKGKSLERFRNAERRYVNDRLHFYSKRLIDYCIKHQAGTLLLTDQTEKQEMAKEESFVLRNWSYYDLITKIRYKAERAGIEVAVE
ncbi:MAG: IS200/IS605 family element transposase accessory protein TnpB [Cyclobacteriaceae bacterium]|nr:IS200/IS605 family element transposase accessory protein TnpB [Cyclobacteriaceae bacterium]